MYQKQSFRLIVTSKPFAVCSLYDTHLDAHHGRIVIAIHADVLAVQPIAAGRKTISSLFIGGGSKIPGRSPATGTVASRKDERSDHN